MLGTSKTDVEALWGQTGQTFQARGLHQHELWLAVNLLKSALFGNECVGDVHQTISTALFCFCSCHKN